LPLSRTYSEVQALPRSIN